MAKSVSQLKNQARREEQRENWSRAIELYTEAIRLSEETGEVSLDLSLYNRVGDLYRRQGDTDQAVHFYHEAVDRYADQGLHTGAIALCNKILRLAPDRIEVHASLGRLHAATGLVAEARKSFREYCSRLEEEERRDEARAARLELARLVDDRELLLETTADMVEAGQEEEALEALVRLWEDAREADEELPEVRARIEELDPGALAVEEEAAAEEADGEEPAGETGGPGTREEPGREGRAPSPGTEASEERPPAGPGPGDAADLEDILLELDEAEPGTGESAPEEPPEEDPGAGELPESPTAMEEPDEDDEAAVHIRYAEVLERSGQPEAAVQQLESVLDGFLSKDRYGPALEVVEKLRELKPDRTAYLRRQAEILETTGADERAVEAWMELARELGGASEEPARTAYERVLKLDPDHRDAREALEGGGEESTDEEAEELDQLLRELGAAPPGRPPRGGEADEDDEEDARPALDEAAARAGDDAAPDDDTGETPAADREPADGTAAPADGETPPEEAEQDGEGYVDLGARIRMRLDAEREAAGARTGAGEYDFDDMLVGFRAQAEETSGEADPEAHVELGVALRQMGQIEDAIREFQVAARAPEPPLRAFELLGEAFIRKDLYSVAVRVLNRALHIPGHADHDLLGILYQLGVAHQEVGDAGKALDCYERIYSVDIDFRDVAERMRTVRAEA